MSRFTKACNTALHRLEITDRAVTLLRLNTAAAVLREVVVVQLIVFSLTPREQGLWYTFISLGLFATFAELGFADMISQRVSNVYATLQLKDGRIEGPPEHMSRLMGLIRYAIGFYVPVIAAVTAVMWGVGWKFFEGEPRWVVWAFLAFVSMKGAELFTMLLQSIYRGFDKVADVETDILKSTLVTVVAMGIALAAGLSIWALALGSCVNFLVTLWFTYRRAPDLWTMLLTRRTVAAGGWARSALPVQARYGINALSAYVAYNTFVPAAYRLEGPEIAGRLGLTLAVIGAVSRVSTAWSRSRAPAFSILVAKGDRAGVNALLKTAFVKTYAPYAATAIAALAVLYVVDMLPPYSGRFLDVPTVALMLMYYAVPMIITPWNVYLRAHGDEPWFIVSAVQASLVALAMLTVLPRYGVLGVIVALNAIHWCVLLPLGATVFTRLRARYDATGPVILRGGAAVTPQ